MKTNRIQIDAPRDGFPLRINSPERKNAVRRMLFFFIINGTSLGGSFLIQYAVRVDSGEEKCANFLINIPICGV
jgi:heme oxygenase